MAIERFQEQNESCVLILSLRSAACGLNLTHAKRVVFLDAAMNEGLERQALARVHRHGQTQPVEAVFLVYRKTIEGRIRAFRNFDDIEDACSNETKIGDVIVVTAKKQFQDKRGAYLRRLLGCDKK
jgi:SNF2 family DNA or RNA helicase